MNLEFLGLNHKLATIYQALLKLGSATAKELASATKLDRTTIYDILQNLEQRGLVYRLEEKKILTFYPHDPKNLLLELKQKEEKLKEILPELTQIHRTSGRSPFIKTYSSESELIKLYESILEIRNLKNYDIICSEQDWLQMNSRYFKDFKKRRADKEIHTRLIMETSPIAEARKQQEHKDDSEIKHLPPAFSALNFSAGCYILPDRTIFISYRKEHVGTEIFSKEITNFMQTIFNFMWKTLA